MIDGWNSVTLTAGERSSANRRSYCGVLISVEWTAIATVRDQKGQRVRLKESSQEFEPRNRQPSYPG
jgi:hypothetical protein